MPTERSFADAARSRMKAGSLLRRGASVLYRLTQTARGRGGLRMSLSPEDEFLLDSRLYNIDWLHTEPHVYSWLSREARPGSVFFDLGAWVGHYTLCAAKRVGPTGRVISCEPSDTPRRYLERHIRLNGFDATVTVLATLVGDEVREDVDFHLLSTGLESSNSIVAGPGGPVRQDEERSTVKMPMTTVDEIVRSTGLIPNLIKIDVEGAEARVLAGASETLRVHRPQVVCAIHPEWMRILGDPPDVVFDIAAAAGYEVVDFDGNQVRNLALQEVLLRPMLDQEVHDALRG